MYLLCAVHFDTFLPLSLGRTDHKGCSYSSTCFLQHFAVAVLFSWLQLASNQEGVDLLITLSHAGNNMVQLSIGKTLQVPEIIPKIYNRCVCSVDTVALMRMKGTLKGLSSSNAATDTSLTALL